MPAINASVLNLLLIILLVQDGAANSLCAAIQVKWITVYQAANVVQTPITGTYTFQTGSLITSGWIKRNGLRLEDFMEVFLPFFLLNIKKVNCDALSSLN